MEERDFREEIIYSEKYFDDTYEYRHVTLPMALMPQVPAGRLLSEREWRDLGVQQSEGWEHFMIHPPEPHILIFRRPLKKEPAEKVESVGSGVAASSNV